MMKYFRTMHLNLFWWIITNRSTKVRIHNQYDRSLRNWFGCSARNFHGSHSSPYVAYVYLLRQEDDLTRHIDLLMKYEEILRR